METIVFLAPVKGEKGALSFSFTGLKLVLRRMAGLSTSTARNPRIDLQGTDFNGLLCTRLDTRECTSTQSVPLDGLLGGF